MKGFDRITGLVPPELEQALNDAFDVPTEVLLRDKHLIRSVPTLYHFTDCAGLIGILRDRTLWASLATTLNDPSEIRHGVARAAALLNSEALAHIDGGFRQQIATTLDLRSTARIRPMDLRTFVVSFCESADEAVHWLHYGRSGTGVALALEPKRLQPEGYDLLPVIYEDQDKDRFFLEIVQASWAHLAPVCAALGGTQAQDVRRRVAEAMATWIGLAAPRLKNRSFAAEREWRLVGFENDEQSPSTKFRPVAGRVVPFQEIPFDASALTGVILGAATPMALDDPGLRMLMLPFGGVSVTRSAVPVRP